MAEHAWIMAALNSVAIARLDTRDIVVRLKVSIRGSDTNVVLQTLHIIISKAWLDF